MFKKTALILAVLLSGFSAVSQLPHPRNVIIMIGDGMGYNHILATEYYLGKKLVFRDFPVTAAVATYPAKAGEYDPADSLSNYVATGYNPSMAWKDTSYLKKDYTESAAAATALATGVKTYNNSIGMSVSHDTLTNLCELAHKRGKSAGVVTSVPFSHATPAGFSAHNAVRSDYAGITRYQLFKSGCEVIMGCGDPGFDNDGKPLEKWDPHYTGDSILWSEIISGKLYPDGRKLVRTRDEFLSLLKGKTPEKVLGCAMINSCLQAGRTPLKGEKEEILPYTTPFIKTVPTLAEMTTGALNVLNKNKKGFFIMAEGGEIDWVAHSNLKGRLIEEVADFNTAVEAVIKWVEENSSWNETLLIVTADHETGLLWGEKPFEGIKDRGKGNLPGMNYFSGNHTNSLVALYAKGQGSDLLLKFADEYDPVRGYFIQNTEIAQLINLLWYEK